MGSRVRWLLVTRFFSFTATQKKNENVDIFKGKNKHCIDTLKLSESVINNKHNKCQTVNIQL